MNERQFFSNSSQKFRDIDREIAEAKAMDAMSAQQQRKAQGDFARFIGSRVMDIDDIIGSIRNEEARAGAWLANRYALQEGSAARHTKRLALFESTQSAKVDGESKTVDRVARVCGTLETFATNRHLDHAATNFFAALVAKSVCAAIGNRPQRTGLARWFGGGRSKIDEIVADTNASLDNLLGTMIATLPDQCTNLEPLVQDVMETIKTDAGTLEASDASIVAGAIYYCHENFLFHADRFDVILKDLLRQHTGRDIL